GMRLEEILCRPVRVHPRHHEQPVVVRRPGQLAEEIASAEELGAMVQREPARVVGDDAAGVDDDGLDLGPLPVGAPPADVVADGIFLGDVGLAPAVGTAVPGNRCRLRRQRQGQASAEEFAPRPAAVHAPQYSDGRGGRPHERAGRCLLHLAMRMKRAASVFASGLVMMAYVWGMPLIREIRKVPVPRLVENIERQLREKPDNVELQLNLARLYAMAYALKVTEHEAVVRGPERMEAWFGDFPDSMPGPTRPAPSREHQERARADLARAVKK